MSAPAARGNFRGMSDFKLVWRQVFYEQLSFWLNPVAAIFTVGFSVIFLVLLGATGGASHLGTLGGLRAIQYYVPGFVAYGVMSTCFNTLAVALVIRRETGLLKRLRLSPLPTWVMLAGVAGSALAISTVQVGLLLVIGKFVYGVVLPHNVGAFAVALVVGVMCFTALGIAASTLIPNQDSGGPIVGVVFFVLLFLSGLWYPLSPGSTLASISGYFPIRHLMLATFAPFDRLPGVSGWDWHDIWIMAAWGVGGAIVAVRRWRWAPRKA